MYETESILISALKSDSQQAFDAIYRMYAARLYAFALQYVKSRETAEELVEDVFVWLWQSRHRVRQEQTLRGLLFIRMRHFLVNAWRATVNAPEYADYLDYVDRLSGESGGMPVEYDDFLRMVDQAIDSLPETQRQVVRLSRFEQLGNKEIALRLGLAEQTVKNQLSTGLKALRRELAKRGGLSLFFLFFVN